MKLFRVKVRICDEHVMQYRAKFVKVFIEFDRRYFVRELVDQGRMIDQCRH